MDAKKLIASRVAQELKDGDVVNLGIGLPTQVLRHVPADLPVCLHSENGISGVGPVHARGSEDRNLIDAVHRSFAPMYRYVALRKKLLGVDELHMYDLYVPVVDGVEMKFTFEEAKEIALKALAPLGEDYLNLLREGFANGWIDVYENVGKRSGAYSSGNSRPHPYVLLNHKDNLDCQFTLAHEMGHALHSYHSCKYQPVSTSDYVIFVAEVASTCNEVLLMRHLLIDLRYNGQFKGKEDVVLPDGSRLDKLRSYNVALSVGYLF